ncbi:MULTISPECIES: asparaginase domain-containing protein [Bradyrhizobium]|uniref:asparaginase domain-containing protein n=1 Tax=Bradyrhizobium elkanii TaxID=29448 RepID=UPI0003F89116|nr:asparaginase domain-containing protein [Bradyrhizobium elkanii]
MAHRPRIAHLAGPTATIQNSPPLVTSNKARRKYGLPPRTNRDGSDARFDALRAQRLAAPATVYVECFSAHPLEADAAELYGPPDGYLDVNGIFRRERMSATDKAVFEIEIRPEDGLYPLPYMARKADGEAWEGECTEPGAPASQARQSFYPDGSRSFEEIDRLSVGAEGVGNLISAFADVDFYRVLPPAGYTKGLLASLRTDVGEGDIPPETRSKDFFAYRPYHLGEAPPRPALARLTNAARRIFDSNRYDGAIYTQGSPQIEEVAYWFNLLIDTTIPICGNAAQRPQGELSHDGPKNITDSVEYIASRVWADEHGRNRAGVIVLQEQRFFAAREVMKVDARPGGYVATGGHGGILGGMGYHGAAVLHYVPALKHTYLSEVNLSKIPLSVPVALRSDGIVRRNEIRIREDNGDLLEGAIPSVSIVKDGGFYAEEYFEDPDVTTDLVALVERKLAKNRLAGFVVEGTVPYGKMTSSVRQAALQKAIYSGLPVVRVGRGSPEGFADPHPYFIAGSNLTATKARMLLMACLLKFGSLPPANNPDEPTAAELAAIRDAVGAYQRIFDTH